MLPSSRHEASGSEGRLTRGLINPKPFSARYLAITPSYRRSSRLGGLMLKGRLGDGEQFPYSSSSKEPSNLPWCVGVQRAKQADFGDAIIYCHPSKTPASNPRPESTPARRQHFPQDSVWCIIDVAECNPDSHRSDCLTLC